MNRAIRSLLVGFILLLFSVGSVFAHTDEGNNTVLPGLENCPTEPLVLDCSVDHTATIDAWLNQVTLVDNCFGQGILTNDYDPASLIPGCGTPTEIVVTFTASDPCPAADVQCQGIIQLTDSTAPQITCPAALTIECGDVNNDALIDAWLATVIATDFCDQNVTITNNYDAAGLSSICPLPAFTSGGLGLPVLFEATDICGNTSQCVAEILLVDSTSPEITCPLPLEIECGDDNTAAIDAWLLSAGVSDACDPSAFVTNNYDPASLTSVCPLPAVAGGGFGYPVLFTAQDNCGLTSTCVGEIRLLDRTPPVISCPPTELVIECGFFNTFIIDDWLNSVSATDACAPFVPVSNDYDVANLMAGCGPGSGELVVNFVATDNCGNSSTCTGTIRMEDTTAPDLAGCPAEPLILGCAGDNTAAIDAWLNGPTGLDLCEGAVVVTNDYDPASVVPVCAANATGGGGYFVTFTAADMCGNASTCSVEVILQDDTPPVIESCPAPLVLECGDDNTAAIESWLNSGIASDFCSPTVDITNNFDPANLTRVCGGVGFTGGGLGLPVIFTATDVCGNATTCVSEIQLFDTTPPVFDNCPTEPLVLECGIDDVTTMVDNWLNAVTITDACDANATVTNDFNPADLVFELGGTILTVTFTATDDCGNVSQCTGEIQLLDTTAPVFDICPVETLVIECGADNTAAIDAWINSVTGTDACQAAVIMRNNYDPAMLSSICPGDAGLEVIFTARDPDGNASICTGEIQLVDSTPPVIDVCPATLTLDCNQNNDAAIDAWLNTAAASDVCNPDVTITNDYVVGSLTPICVGGGGLIVTFTATDICGNFTNCTSEILLQDITPPVFDVCPASPLMLECGDDNTLAIEAWLATAAASDVCSPNVTITNSYDPALLPPGCSTTQTVVFTATDECGNAVECSAEIIMLDTAGPVFDNCPLTPLVVECGVDNTAEIDAWLNAVTATDACGTGFTVVNNYDAANLLPSCAALDFAGGVGLPVVFTATDDCGNTSTCVGAIILEDTTAPEISCPADVTVECGSDISPASMGAATGADSCRDFNIIYEDGFTPECGNSGVLQRTWIAFDDCFNETACVQTITIVDTTPPVLSATPEDITINCDAGLPADPGITATDNCGETLTVVYTPATECIYGTTVTNTWTVQDCSGNITTYTQNVTIEDDVPPVVLCQDITLQLDADGLVYVPVELFDAGSSDPSGISHMYTQPAYLSCPDVGPNSVTLYVVDNLGNVGECTATVTLLDSNGPELFCMDYTAAIAPGEIVTITVDDVLDYVYDGCGVDNVTVSPTMFAEPGTYTVTVFASDLSGNVSSCTSTVEITGLPVACEPFMLLHNTVPSNVYQVSQTIISSGDVLNPEVVTYKAGVEISLLPGFEVELGAEFCATIEDCPVAVRAEEDEKDKEKATEQASEKQPAKQE